MHFDPLDELLRQARGRALGAAMWNRNIATGAAAGYAITAVAFAATSIGSALPALILGAGFAWYAVHCRRRFDSILTRSLAAALAEGGRPDLAEAA